MADYIVKRGDTLWAIASANKSKISGSTINAKINTLVSVNKIKNRDLIYPGQKINFSAGKSNPASSTPASASKVTIDVLALQASDTTEGRSVYASWTWTKDHTKGFQYIWAQYKNGQWVANNPTSFDYPENVTSKNDRDMLCYAEFTADTTATKVKFQILPVATTYKSGDKDVPYFKLGSGSGDVAWATKEYNFADNPPLAPGVPTVAFDELNDRKLVMSYSFTEAEKRKLSATSIRFNIIKNNTTSIYTSDPIPIQKKANDYYFVSHEKVLDYGADYKVRACSVGSKKQNSAWSGFSEIQSTRPSAPKKITVCRCDLVDGAPQVHIEWSKVSNAAKYTVEYHTDRNQLEQGQTAGYAETTDNRTYIDIQGLESGKQYFFQVRASNSKGESNPSPIVSLAIGDRPAAPTTWSSAKSAFVGESMELNWTHNTIDGSAQTYAELALKINDGEWKTYTFKNKTTAYSGEQTETESFTYGTVVSYKGEMHVKIDTEHSDLKDAAVLWKVRTIGIRGISGSFQTSDYSEWSADDRIFHIYDMPTFELTVTGDLAGEEPFEDVEIPPENEGEDSYVVQNALTKFPFYINANVSLDSYEIQRPIGYYLQVISEDFYETVDDAGRSKTVNPGDAVYSKYFTVPVSNPTLTVVMSAENIDLEPLMRYTVKCDADMSTGLAIGGTYEFNVLWADSEYQINAIVNIDEDTYAATIIPNCEDMDGNLIENVTLSVYRREYDGSLTEIATNVPNSGTAVYDPHPSLDYARYRLIATDINTGAISFYDLGGQYVGCSSVILQWDEEWSAFDADEQTSMEAPSGSGSMLILPYNVAVSDNRQRETAKIAYAGREYPVLYHGTMINESSSWKTTIPKDDVETIYALRRLSLWTGPVYVREPSGMGFWANVVPSFDIDNKSVSIPVTLSVTRVEGGV